MTTKSKVEVEEKLKIQDFMPKCPHCKQKITSSQILRWVEKYRKLSKYFV
jgi:hypothetical protein